MYRFSSTLDNDSRCSNRDDFVKVVNILSNFDHFDKLYIDETPIFQNFALSWVPLNRKSTDTIVGGYGYQMLDFCKGYDLFILNGRVQVMWIIFYRPHMFLSISMS
jgi:hypothetical protein